MTEKKKRKQKEKKKLRPLRSKSERLVHCWSENGSIFQVS